MLNHLNKCLELAKRLQEDGKICYSQYHRGWNGASVHVIEYIDHSNNIRKLVVDQFGLYRRKLQVIAQDERQ